MKKIIFSLYSLSVYLIIILLLIFLYVGLSRTWSPVGGGTSQLFKLEIPLIILISTILYFPKINNKLIKYVLPIIPVFILYSLFDLFYSFFGKSPRPSDFQNYHTIFDFSPGLAIGLILYALLVPIIISVLFYLASMGLSKKNIYVTLVLRLFASFALVTLLLSDVATEYTKNAFLDIEWSQERTIRKNGRFASFLYFGMKEKENLTALKKHKQSGVNVYEKLYPGEVSNNSNIHIIVLESFIDPRILEGVVFDRSPLAAELKAYFHEVDGDFSHVISPVYGGGTSQAEFELLTGVKALSKINSTEFNVLNGGLSSSLVNRLKELNYHTIATVASGSGYYNSKQAYKSLGFSKVAYLEENGFKVREGDTRIFDGDAFGYSFKKIRYHIENDKTSIISYVLGMYGHFPYERNETIRPDVVNAKHKDTRIQRISNQFYYRTKALAKYIKQIISIDPESIIYVTSDHLPPLLGDDIKYKKNNAVNISLLLNGGQQIDVTGKHYYEIPLLLWDILSKNKNNRVINNVQMEKLYFQILNESIGNVK